MAIHIENVWKPQWVWGSIYTNTAQDTDFAESGVGVTVVRSADLETGENIGLTVGASGVITTLYSGFYYLYANFSFSGASDDLFVMNFRINGVNIDNGELSWKMFNGEYRQVSMNTLYQINGNETIDIFIANNTDTTSISLQKFNQTVIKLY